MPSRSGPPVEIPPAMEESIRDFVTSLELERGRSPKTVEAYESDLSQAAVFLAKQGRTDWKRVTRDDATAWAQNLSDRKLASSSAARKLSALRSGRCWIDSVRISQIFDAMICVTIRFTGCSDHILAKPERWCA